MYMYTCVYIGHLLRNRCFPRSCFQAASIQDGSPLLPGDMPRHGMDARAAAGKCAGHVPSLAGTFDGALESCGELC